VVEGATSDERNPKCLSKLVRTSALHVVGVYYCLLLRDPEIEDEGQAVWITCHFVNRSAGIVTHDRF
jgi:hypothetical protein